MTFEALHEDMDCNCLENAVEDNVTVYARRIDTKDVKDKYFLSAWERYVKNGETPPWTECQDKCDNKSVSINKSISGKTIENINEEFKLERFFAPKGKRFLCKFVLKKDTALVQSSPVENNPHHHDLFKCDSFTLESIDVVSITEIPLLP